MREKKQSIQSLFVKAFTRIEKQYAGKYRCKQIMNDRVYQACGLLDMISENTGVHNVMFMLDPANGFDADIYAEMEDLTLDCHTDKVCIDALTCADSLSIKQSDDGNLVLMLHFNDFWVVTR